MVPKPDYVTGIRCSTVNCGGVLLCFDVPVMHSLVDIYSPREVNDGFSLTVHCRTCRLEMTVRFSDGYRLIKHEDESSITWEVVNVLEAIARGVIA